MPLGPLSGLSPPFLFIGYRDPRSSRYAISEENAQFNQGALLRLHWSGPYRRLIGRREGRVRVLERVAIAGVASDRGRIAGARMDRR